ncbi:MAG: transcriptional regulator [Pseudonocardia sp. SCN 72-86]|nr:MAG: transcriptional regulator [Pseudonocardia sp. SCN 72-86]
MSTASLARPRVRRADIVAAALELFADKGYLATTMDDIGRAVNVRGPSLYKHVASKQDLLVEIMETSIATVLRDHAVAVGSTDDVADQLRRAVEAHVRFHARHRLEAFVGTRELRHLSEENRAAMAARRRDYERGFRVLVERGVAEGRFRVGSVRLTTYSLLDMGVGVSVWFRDGEEFSVDEVAYRYGDLAMRLVCAA